jgi:hypothetical protein
MLEQWSIMLGYDINLREYLDPSRVTDFQMIGQLPIKDPNSENILVIVGFSYVQGSRKYANSLNLPNPFLRQLCFGPILLITTMADKCTLVPLPHNFLQLVNDLYELDLDDEGDIDLGNTDQDDYRDGDEEDGSDLDDPELCAEDSSAEIIDDDTDLYSDSDSSDSDSDDTQMKYKLE